MEKYVMVLALFYGDQAEMHAKGTFSTERNCWRWSAMVSSSIPTPWVGRCMPISEYRSLYPALPLDMES